MIKINHRDLVRINKDYTEKILNQFVERKACINTVITLLQSQHPVTEDQIKGNVKALLKAVKVILNTKKLPTPQALGNKETDILIHHLNENRIFDAETMKTGIQLIMHIQNQIDSIFNEHLEKLISIEAAGLQVFDNYFSKHCKLDNEMYLYFFDYENYYHILNSNIANRLGINCCPYCNRNYITSVQNIKGERIIGPTYDHYFHKKIYKFLTLSFYNLIPSCYICNSNLKGQIEFSLTTHLHPYYDEFGTDAIFDFDLKLLISSKSSEIIFEPIIKIQPTTSMATILKLKGYDKDVKGKKSGNIKVFQLEEIYKSHFDTVEEIHTKFDQNSPYYINSIKDKLVALGVTEAEFYRFHFHNYYTVDNFHKKPLSKLTKDIYSKMKNLQEGV
jgi:hypothetical protein